MNHSVNSKSNACTKLVRLFDSGRVKGSVKGPCVFDNIYGILKGHSGGDTTKPRHLVLFQPYR